MARISYLCFLALIFVCLFIATANAKLREGECEVCLKVIQDFREATKNSKSLEESEAIIRKTCKKYSHPSEKRLCYYIGGTEDAATSILRLISQPLKNHMPNEKICEKLKTYDDHICGVKYTKFEEVDYSKVDFNKMTVRELKNLLGQWGEKCDGCTEKSDFVRLANKVKDKHVKPSQNEQQQKRKDEL